MRAQSVRSLAFLVLWVVVASAGAHAADRSSTKTYLIRGQRKLQLNVPSDWKEPHPAAPGAQAPAVIECAGKDAAGAFSMKITPIVVPGDRKDMLTMPQIRALVERM